MSIFEIAIAPHRNAMRARYKDNSEKSTNGVGMIAPLHLQWYGVANRLRARVCVRAAKIRFAKQCARPSGQ